MENTENRYVDLRELSHSITQVRAEIGKVMVGQQRMIDQMLCALLADGHVLIEGVPGIAKTLAAKLMAKCIAADFSRIQFTPDLMPSDILGTSIFNVKTQEFEFRKGPIFSNIILIDEINRAPAKTQSSLFEVMEEKQITIEGYSEKMEAPFLVLATQNPIEQEGTYRLPEAQLDRFLFKIEVLYPDLNEEVQILQNHTEWKRTHPVDLISAVISPQMLKDAQATVRNIHVEQNILSYIARLVQKTRSFPAIYLGASPRASIAILNTSRAMAAMDGRDFVTPEDVQEVAYPVLRHRIMLTPEREMEGATANEIIRQIIESEEIPR